MAYLLDTKVHSQIAFQNSLVQLGRIFHYSALGNIQPNPNGGINIRDSQVFSQGLWKHANFFFGSSSYNCPRSPCSLPWISHHSSLSISGNFFMGRTVWAVANQLKIRGLEAINVFHLRGCETAGWKRWKSWVHDRLQYMKGGENRNHFPKYKSITYTHIHVM